MNIDKVANELEKKAESLDKITSEANLALTEMRIQFETLAEMQKEERLLLQKMYNDSVEKLSDRHEKQIKHWKNIVIGLIVTICLIIGSIIGGAIYLFANYDILVGYAQESYVGGDGTSTINDGIHINHD